MEIKQFEDKALAHFSYAILSQGKMALIDPSRDCSHYLAFAKEHNADVVAIVETHSHADFVSGHLELHRKTGATVYCSPLTGATYPHLPLEDASSILLGEVVLRALSTPGHSLDSLCILLQHKGLQKAVFTGDTLFVGDCGRPDLREEQGNSSNTRTELARQMYVSLRTKLLNLSPETLVYPAHGAGSLCGKHLSEANYSTIGEEKLHNWSLQDLSEKEFVEVLTSDQPFIPQYFAHDVAVNKTGAPDLAESLAKVPVLPSFSQINKGSLLIDGRSENLFKKEHYPNAINIQNGGKFETWLGAFLKPHETCYLIGTDTDQVNEMLWKASKIGYETKVAGLLVFQSNGGRESQKLDLQGFRSNPDAFTIVDVRNASEAKEHVLFKGSLAIPLPELRDRLHEISVNKPIVVHCAGGYRSAIGASLLEGELQGIQVVFDLSEAVKEFSSK